MAIRAQPAGARHPAAACHRDGPTRWAIRGSGAGLKTDHQEPGERRLRYRGRRSHVWQPRSADSALLPQDGDDCHLCWAQWRPMINSATVESPSVTKLLAQRIPPEPDGTGDPSWMRRVWDGDSAVFISPRRRRDRRRPTTVGRASRAGAGGYRHDRQNHTRPAPLAPRPAGGCLGRAGAWAASTVARVDPTAAAAGDPIRMGRLNLASSTATTLQTKTSRAAYLVNQLGAGTAVKGLATSGNHHGTRPDERARASGVTALTTTACTQTPRMVTQSMHTRRTESAWRRMGATAECKRCPRRWLFSRKGQPPVFSRETSFFTGTRTSCRDRLRTPGSHRRDRSLVRPRRRIR